MHDTPEKCQERIKERGDSIEEEFHTLEDLYYYDSLFWELADYASLKQYNVHFVSRVNREDESIEEIEQIIKNFLS